MNKTSSYRIAGNFQNGKKFNSEIIKKLILANNAMKQNVIRNNGCPARLYYVCMRHAVAIRMMWAGSVFPVDLNKGPMIEQPPFQDQL